MSLLSQINAIKRKLADDRTTLGVAKNTILGLPQAAKKVATVARDMAIKAPTETLVVKPALRASQAVGTGVAAGLSKVTGNQDYYNRAIEQSQKDKEYKVPILNKLIGQTTIKTPSYKRAVGEGLEAASYLYTPVKAVKAVSPIIKGVSVPARQAVSNIARGAVGGYMADVGMGLQDNEPVKQALKPGLGTALGAAIPATGAAYQGGKYVAGEYSKLTPYQKKAGFAKVPLSGNADDVGKTTVNKNKTATKTIGVADSHSLYTPRMKALIKKAKEKGEPFPFTKFTSEEQKIFDKAFRGEMETFVSGGDSQFFGRNTSKKSSKARVDQAIPDPSVQGHMGSEIDTNSAAQQGVTTPTKQPLPQQKPNTKPNLAGDSFQGKTIDLKSSSDNLPLAPRSLGRLYTEKVKKAIGEKVTDLIEKVQDSQVRVRNLVNRTDVKIDDISDPYLKEALYHGRVSTKIQEGKDTANQILQDLKNTGISRKDVSDYLVARHAPERNLAIGERAAGISTDDARLKLAQIESSPKGAEIKKIAEQVQELNNKTLDTLKEGGVISDDLYNTLRNKYKYHIPLNRVFEETEDIGQALSSRGFDVRSTGIERAKGSEREVSDILTNVVANYEQAIIKAEKNIVDQATLNFVRQNKKAIGGLIKEVKLPIMPVAKVTHKGQVFNDVMDKVAEIVDKYGGTLERKLKTGRVFGKYQPITNTITTRFGTSKETLLHEFGHLLDTKFGLKQSDFFNRESLIELRKVADLRKGRTAYVRKGEEKIAEFVSMYFSDFKNAQRVAPKTTAKFTRFLIDKPELKELTKVMRSRSRVEELVEETIFRRQQFTNDPSILTMRENGKPVYLKIADPKLATALKGINREKLPSILHKVGAFTRVYSSLATRFNPEFALPNKLRDLQETMVYLAAQKEIGFKGSIKMAAKDFKQRNTVDVLDALRGKNTEGAKLYKEMQSLGGTTGGMSLSTRKTVEINIDKLEKLAKSKTKKAFSNLAEYIDGWNTIFEDSTRLGVYRQALEQGLSKDRAAFLAKEASINFNRMGTSGPVVNALYMFSNASIQGSAKMLRSLKNPKVLGATILAVGGSVAAISEWNDQVDPEWRDKVSKWDRLNGLPVVIPNDSGGIKYITIPVSWGIKPIKVMADYAYDAASGEDFEVKGALSDLLASTLEAYNPVGGTDVWSAISPTILDVPLTEVSRNKTWSGNKIYPDYDPNAPDDIKYFSSLRDTFTGRTAISLSEILNSKANIAISPAVMKYLYEQYVGGAGRAVSKTVNVIAGGAKGKLPEASEFPLISRFYKSRTSEEVGVRSSGNTNDLKDILQDQSRDRFTLKNQAIALDKELQNLSPEEANARYKQAKQGNPELAEKLKEVVEERKLGLTYEEKLMKQLGVENGERAKYIDQQIMKLPTSEERNAYYRELKRKKIISDQVARQIKKLRQQQ